MSLEDDPLEAVVTFVKRRGEIIAFFRAYRQKGEKDFTKTKPELIGSGAGYWAVEGYAHVGQHGYFDERILLDGRRATPEEYGPLKKELEGLIGYIVYPHQRGRLKTRGRWYGPRKD